MTHNDPFASWSEDYKHSQATLTARQLKLLTANAHQTKRELLEAGLYYESRQWVAEGIEAQQLDTLLNDLREKAETAGKLARQASEQLDAILQSQQAPHAITPAAERRAQLLSNTTLPPNEKSVEPTPLEAFLQTARLKNTKPRSRKRNLSM